MADLGGEELLTGTIVGLLSQLTGVSYPIKIHKAHVLADANGDYRRVIEVQMASGTYYVSITDTDPGQHDPGQHEIEEEP